MKRDWLLIRKLLVDESIVHVINQDGDDDCPWSEEAIAEHRRLLVDRGWLAVIQDRLEGTRYEPTWKGIEAGYILEDEDALRGALETIGGPGNVTAPEAVLFELLCEPEPDSVLTAES